MARVKKVYVSIIIVFYQDEKALFNTLDSVQKHRSKYNYEVILVDNSRKKNFKKVVCKKFQNIVYLKSPKNSGYGGGNNLGAEFAKGEFLFFLNPDTLLEPGVVDRLVGFLRNNKNAAIVAPNLIKVNGKVFDQLGTRELNPVSAIFSLSFINKIFPNNSISRNYWASDLPKNKKRRLFAVPGSAFMIRSSVFQRIGGFDENMFMYFEESDMGMRLKKLGYESWIIPDAEVVHKWLSKRRKNGKYNLYISESRFYYFKKHFGLPTAYFVDFFTRLNKYSLVFLSISAIAIFTLFYKIGDYFRFFSDAGWYYLEAKNVLTQKYLPLVGIPSSVPVFRQGALWTYLLSIALWVGRGNPLAGGYLASFIGLISIMLTYFVINRYHNRKAALICALLASSSPLIISSLRLPYHTSPIFLFSIILFWQYKRTVKDGNKLNFFFLGFAFALIFQNELASFLLLPIMAISLYIEKRKIRFSQAVSAASGYFWGVTPFIIWDLRDGYFLQTVGFPIWFVLKIWEAVFKNTFRVSQLTNLEQYGNFVTNLIFPYSPLISYVLTIAAILYASILFLGKQRRNIASMYFWLVFGFIGFFVRGTFSDAYKPIMFLPIIFFIAMLVWRLFEKYIYLGRILLIILVGANLQFLLKNQYYSEGRDQKYFSQLQAARFIVSNSEGESFKFNYLGPAYQFQSGGDHFTYLLWWLGNEPVHFSNLEYTLFTKDKKDLFKDEIVHQFGYYSVVKYIK